MILTLPGNFTGLQIIETCYKVLNFTHNDATQRWVAEKLLCFDKKRGSGYCAIQICHQKFKTNLFSKNKFIPDQRIPVYTLDLTASVEEECIERGSIQDRLFRKVVVHATTTDGLSNYPILTPFSGNLKKRFFEALLKIERHEVMEEDDADDGNIIIPFKLKTG